MHSRSLDQQFTGSQTGHLGATCSGRGLSNHHGDLGVAELWAPDSISLLIRPARLYLFYTSDQL